MWWCLQWHQCKLKNLILISISRTDQTHNSYIIKEMLGSIDVTLCWPKKPPVSSGILAPFVWKPFFSCYCSGFFYCITFVLNMMWFTWENKLSNVPLQSESRFQKLPPTPLSHTPKCSFVLNVCTVPVPNYAIILNVKNTHFLCRM